MAFSSIQLDKAAAVVLPRKQITLLEFLRLLLKKLWKESDLFSGKRPFGDGDWQFEVYEALIKAKLVPGTLDEDGYVKDIDTEEADDLVLALIQRLH